MSVIVVSAAIYGLRNKSNISIFILHPKGRVSPIQEAQMTTVTDANVHNLAVKGTFDDCQVCIFHVEICTFIRAGYLLDNILRTSSRHSSVTKNSTRSTGLVQSTLSTGLVSLLRPSTTSSPTSTNRSTEAQPTRYARHCPRSPKINPRTLQRGVTRSQMYSSLIQKWLIMEKSYST